MKIKKRKTVDHIGSADSYHGIKDMKVWFDLNAGEEVEIDEIPAELKDYVEKVKKEKKDGD